MTPEEIAQRVGWKSTKGPGWRLAHENDIADAIRHAVAEERERTLGICTGHRRQAMAHARAGISAAVASKVTAEEIAAAIRSGVKEGAP